MFCICKTHYPDKFMLGEFNAEMKQNISVPVFARRWRVVNLLDEPTNQQLHGI